MAEIRAFRGYRYDLGKVGALADVVAPPYDVIDAKMQQRLYEASEYNAIRLELTQDQPDDDEIDNRYTRAARTLSDWLADDTLLQDSARSLYVYEQEFDVEGTTYQRRGFFARIKLEPFGEGKIYPHEQTLSGPKADRLKLYQATGFNISPIFGLYPDEQGEIFAKLEPLIRSAPPIEATDHLGVRNRLWPVSDSSIISQVVGLMGPKPIYIADGHHRYETGLKYLEEQAAAGTVTDNEAPANFCLMMLVGMSDPGLAILPTHRLISGLPDISTDDLKEAISDHFEILARYPGDSAACWEHVQMEDSQSVLGLGTIEDNHWLAVKLKDDAVMEELVPNHSAEWRSLGVSILHKLVLEKLIRGQFGTPTCRYVHLLEEVDEAVTAKRCQVAALVPPVGMFDVETIAGHGETMPPKSTYFYPKLLTGMVFNSLKKD